jgi:predicted PurR-regulated permease PerM
LEVEHFLKNKLFVALVYVLMGTLILFLLLQIRPVISAVFQFVKAVSAPFLIAMIISYILHPVVNLLSGRKVPRTVAVLLIYAIFITAVAVILMNLIPVFMKQWRELNEHLPQFTMKAQSWFDGFYDSRMLPEMIREGINQAMVKLQNAISSAVGKIVNQIGATINMVFVAFIVPFLAFYILKDFHLLERTVLTIVPKPHRRQVVRLLMDIDRALGNYIRGQFLVCLLVGLAAYIGYWLIGLPYPLLMASIVGIFNIIPYLGPFFGAVPAVIVASTVSLKMVLLVIAVNVLVQILEGNIISPQVVGRTLKIHPLTIIFVLLIGGELAGIVGMILAVPFFAALKVIVQHVFIYYVKT